MQAEAGSSLCPFQQETSNQVGLGLMQWSRGRRTALENFMWSNGVSSEQFRAEMNRHTHVDPSTGRQLVCSNPGAHPQAFLDRVLELQVRFMFYELSYTTERTYMNYINYPINKSGTAGVRSYAELFCVLALRPGSGVGEINNIQDLGVQNALQASSYGTGRISYSNLNGRRNNAERVFQQFLTSHT